MNLNEVRLSGETKYAGRVITMQVDTVRLPDGNTATREVVRHPGGVCVAALSDRQELLFVRQFRYPYETVLLELPAGKLSPGEDPALCAARELKEETGAEAAELTSLGVLYPSVGYTDERLHLYMATGLSFGECCPDEDEFLEVERIPLLTAVEMVEAGELPDAKTQALVLRAYLRLKNAG